ncbi:MAG: Endolytic murein transglycosylase [Candidatus Levybacteria bacterium]|nr:Endolytic murein transglycosylase [Candidatus Levybacteria bacterium]
MKKLTTVSLLLVIIIFGSILWWANGISPVNSANKQPVIFVVQKGAGLKEISTKLETAGLIKNRIIFFLYARFGKFEGKIQAGDFRLSPSMSTSEIAQNLTHGTLDVWTTIPEGKRGTEIAEILKEKIPTYDSSWPLSLTQNEGYLFPDTYLIPKDASIASIVTQMKNNFEQKYQSLDTSKTKLSKDEIVKLASLVEREAKFEEDRPLVASVLLNRFGIGMKLDIDATVQYLLGYSTDEKTWWRKNITFADLEISSPYNTYRNAGLPPTPIANPGIEAMRAVISPADTNFVYYISDSAGNLHFAKTLNEQNANIKKFGL